MSFNTPINFPDPANQGDQYTFEGITYTYDKASGLPGYWKIVSPGQIGPATATEINLPIVDDSEDGTDLRYVTPKGLSESKYLDSIPLQIDGGTVWELGKGQPLEIMRSFNTGGSEGGLKITRVDDGIDFNMEYAGIGKTGTVQLATSYKSDSESQAATLKAVKYAAMQGYDSAYARHEHATNGWFKVKDNYNSSTGFVICWGYHTLTVAEKVAMGGLTYFPTDTNINANSYYVGMTPRNSSNNKEYSMSIEDMGTNKFEWKCGATKPNGFYWFAIGRCNGVSGSGAGAIPVPYNAL